MSWVNYFLEYNRYLNFGGILFILGIAYTFSRNRNAINWKLVFNALALQIIIAFCVLKTSMGQFIVQKLADGVGKLDLFADHGIGFVFGNLADAGTPWGFVFAIKVLPIIIFFGALMSALFHLGIVQPIVSVVSKIVQPLLGTSGAETLCAIANSFLGQTEAPLLIRNYLGSMTKSEILVVMVSGMGTISGAILVVFASMGVPVEHMLAASVMAIPSSIMIAKMLYPETGKPKTVGDVNVTFERKTSNVLDAISVGTSDGLQLALNVGAMLISFLALLAMINFTLEYGAYLVNYLFMYADIDWRLPLNFNINMIFSWVFAPFAYLLGFTHQEALKVGQLLGTKVAVNEVIAYSEMLKMNLSPRTVDIVTYALCGFSNFSCIGIQVGGIGALVPEKRKWLTELGLYAVLGGTLTNLLSAMVASLML